MAPRAVLVGLPGAGKSTIGRRLAKALGVDFLDSDAAIEASTGRTIADIFATDGEPEFRRIEEQVIRSALAEHDGVLSLGGGAITTAGVREALAGQTVVFLEISAAEGVRRTGGGAVRPLLAGPGRAEKFRALMSQRAPLYRRVATIRVNTNRRNPGAVVRYIVTRLAAPGAGRPKPGRPARPARAAKPARPGESGKPTQPAGATAAPAPGAAAAERPQPTPPTPATPAALAARHTGGRP